MTKIAYCFDLDGTLTSSEILPCIAAELGISEEMATLTKITMDGLITFQESLRLRVAILSRVSLETIHNILKDVKLNNDLKCFIQSRVENCFIITGNLNIWIYPLIDILGCEFYSSDAKIDGDRIVLNKILNKGDAIKSIRESGFEKIISIGDGANDVPMFKNSDISIAFGGVHSPTNSAIAASDFVVHSSKELCRLLKML